MTKNHSSQDAANVNVVLNWAEELNARAPQK